MSAKFSFRRPTLTYLVNTLHSSLLLQASLCFCFIPETFSPLQNLQERHCLKDIKFWSCIARKSKSRLSFPRPLLYWRSNTSYIFYKNLYFLKTLWKKSKNLTILLLLVVPLSLLVFLLFIILILWSIVCLFQRDLYIIQAHIVGFFFFFGKTLISFMSLFCTLFLLSC